MNLRRVGCLLLAVLGGQALALAQTGQGGFAEGNALYQQGNYQGAQQAYLRQLQSGPVTAALLANLGSSCRQLGQLGWAIVYYERAMLATPRDRELRTNLATALTLRRVPPSTEAPGWGQVLWRGVLDRLTLNELTLLALLSYLLVCGLLYRWLRSGELRRRYRLLLGLAGLALLLLGALTLSKAQGYHNPTRAVIVVDDELRNGPAESFQSLRRTYQGEMVRLRSAQGLWREVRFESGAEGWVPQSSVEPIVPPRQP